LAHGRRRRDHDAGAVPVADDHARHHHGFLRADHGPPEWLWYLLPADSDWRGRYGFSRPEYAFVLDHLSGAVRHGGRIFCPWRRAARGLDGLSAAECRGSALRTGRRRRPIAVGDQYRDLLRRVA